MRTQAPLNETTSFDREMAIRYRIFREKYVSKNQQESAVLLGINQAHISRMEAGKKSIGAKATRMMITKYHLNTRWLSTGIGPDRILPTKEEGTLIGKNVSQLRAMVESLEGKVALLEKQLMIIMKNEEFFISRIEKALKDIENSANQK